MKLKTYLLFCLVTFCLVAIRFSIAFDNPEHLVIPNSECPICQAYNSAGFMEFNGEVSAVSIILTYLNEQKPYELYFNSNIHKELIRAPPIF